jgi:hypothetical protein
MKNKNPVLKVGDRIKLLHMDGETSISPLTKGTVKDIQKDPFEDGEYIVSVTWDSGSTLSLLSGHDVYKKISQEINESSGESLHKFIGENRDIIDNFDWRFLRDYLQKVRDSGVVNMFESAPFLYMGKEMIDRFHGLNQEENEEFQEVLNMADQAKMKLIQGSVKLLQKKGKEIDVRPVERVMEKSATKLVGLYITFPLKSN